MEQTEPNFSEQDIQDAEHAMRREMDEQIALQNAVLEQVRALVSAKAFGQITDTLFDSGVTHSYLIADQPLGTAQSEDFILGDVYVHETAHGGICGDDYAGTMSLPLGNGQFFQFNYAC
jgi:hypothetical protein